MIACVARCGLSEDLQHLRRKDAAVQQFHDKFNEMKFEEIYSTATDALKAADTRFVDLIETVHRKLGAFKSATTISSNVTTSTRGTVVSAVVKSQFAEGTATETFTFRVTGDDVLLLDGYQIDSTDLILK